MDSADTPNSSLSDLMLDLGKSVTTSRGADPLIEELMRVAGEPLLLQALVVRQGEVAPNILPPGRPHLRDVLLRDDWQTGKQRGQERTYGVVEPSQTLSPHPGVFEPRDDDKRGALCLSNDPVDTNPVCWHGGLAASLAGAVVLVFVLLGVYT